MTTRLYYSDSYSRAFSARILSHLTVDGRPAVVLDQTLFYPASGGQPCDRGALNGVPVLDVAVRASDGAVVHVLAAAVTGDTAEGEIDWRRRFDHMQQHTGQHLLSQALARAAAADTLSFHLGAERVTIDVDAPRLSDGDLARAEALANEVAQSNVAVRAWFPGDDELAAMTLRRAPELAGPVRIVAIGDFDVTPCGGTHVARAAEVGLIQTLGTAKAGRGTRVEFVCGERARRDYGQKHALVDRMARDFSVGYDALGDAVARLRAEHQAARRALNAARGQLLDYEAAELAAAAIERDGLRIVRRAWPERAAEEVRGLAERLAQQPRTVALLGAAGDKAHIVLACAEGVETDMARLFKSALGALPAARGGGSPRLAQGGGAPAELAQVEQALDWALTDIST